MQQVCPYCFSGWPHGEVAEQATDFYHDAVIIDKERSLGHFDLHLGENLLEVTIVGQRPEARPGYMFGLDYLRLTD